MSDEIYTINFSGVQITTPGLTGHPAPGRHHPTATLQIDYSTRTVALAPGVTGFTLPSSSGWHVDLQLNLPSRRSTATINCRRPHCWSPVPDFEWSDQSPIFVGQRLMWLAHCFIGNWNNIVNGTASSRDRLFRRRRAYSHAERRSPGRNARAWRLGADGLGRAAPDHVDGPSDLRPSPTSGAGLSSGRISAGAFGSGRPHQDLFLSQGHSICIDLIGEVLSPLEP